MIDRILIGTLYLHPELFPGCVVKAEWLEDPYREMFKWLKGQAEKNTGLKANATLYERGGIEECGLESDFDFYEDVVESLRVRWLDKMRRSFARDLVQGTDPERVLHEIRGEIDRVLNSKEEIRETHVSAYIEEFLEVTAKAQASSKEGKRGVSGIDTGHEEFNEYFGGWQKEDQVVLAGRPGMGKTTQALKWALEALSQDRKVVFFSLEMSAVQLVRKLVAELTDLDTGQMLGGAISDEDFATITGAVDKLRELGLWIETDCYTLDQIVSKSRTINNIFDADVIVVDYLQLVDNAKRGYSKEQQVSEASRRLKQLYRELKVTGWTLSQLSRKCEERGDKRPILSDLRDSGAIEQDADIVVMFYRPEYYEDMESNYGMEWIVKKNRTGGRLGVVGIGSNPVVGDSSWINIKSYE